MLYLDAVVLTHKFCLHVIAVILEHLRSAGGVSSVCLGTVLSTSASAKLECSEIYICPSACCQMYCQESSSCLYTFCFVFSYFCSSDLHADEVSEAFLQPKYSHVFARLIYIWIVVWEALSSFS